MNDIILELKTFPYTFFISKYGKKNCQSYSRLFQWMKKTHVFLLKKLLLFKLWFTMECLPYNFCLAILHCVSDQV